VTRRQEQGQLMLRQAVSHAVVAWGHGVNKEAVTWQVGQLRTSVVQLEVQVLPAVQLIQAALQVVYQGTARRM
jgi:hypothetical protein